MTVTVTGLDSLSESVYPNSTDFGLNFDSGSVKMVKMGSSQELQESRGDLILVRAPGPLVKQY